MHGNTGGLGHAAMRGLERIYRRKIPPGQLITEELLSLIAKLSRETGRQIAALIDRKGKITHVVAGNDHQIVIPNLGQRRVAGKRLAGYRCVHTHLKGEPLTQDDVNDLLLLRLDAMASVEVKKDGSCGKIMLAHIAPGAEDSCSRFGPAPFDEVRDYFRGLVESVEAELERTAGVKKVAGGQQALLIHVSDQPRARMEASLNELAELARSAGITAAARVVQRRDVPDPKFLMGKGKLQEFMIKALSLGAGTVIFDTELTPGQLKAISDFTDLEVMDRTQLILGIFEKRAQSRDGKVRVQLAHMKYLLPRLGAKESALSRIRGGIGLRGPGETAAEVQRRHLQNRIASFERELESLGKKREQKRKGRLRAEVRSAAIVGYTNAGKTTLVNRLTGSDFFTRDLLFATLDPAARRLYLPGGETIVVNDTVGLIRNMPESLRGVFRATLEELMESDVIVNVADIADADLEEHLKATQEIIRDVGLHVLPVITVLNKVELLQPEEAQNLVRRHNAIGVSALTGDGVTRLLAEIEARLPNKAK